MLPSRGEGGCTAEICSPAVVASSQKGLRELTNRLNAVMKEYAMKINVKKTKVMCKS